ncbi:type II secretion system protein GspM, partial [Acinetobacter baumannii]
MNDRAHDRPTSAAASRTRSAPGLSARQGKLRPRIPARWRERAEAFWTARNPREQTLLAVGGALLALTIGYSVLWEP